MTDSRQHLSSLSKSTRTLHSPILFKDLKRLLTTEALPQQLHQAFARRSRRSPGLIKNDHKFHGQRSAKPHHSFPERRRGTRNPRRDPTTGPIEPHEWQAPDALGRQTWRGRLARWQTPLWSWWATRLQKRADSAETWRRIRRCCCGRQEAGLFGEAAVKGDGRGPPWTHRALGCRWDGDLNTAATRSSCCRSELSDSS